MKYDLINDVAQLAVIRPTILNKFCRLAESCISDYIAEAKLADEDLTEIDLGIGKLELLIVDDSLEYQFRPSVQLEKKIIQAYQSGQSELTEKVEEGLANRLLSAYKELF